MFEQTLSQDTKKALALLGESNLLKQTYLARGSACALYLGHRISVDLDFFIPKEFDNQKMIQDLKNLGKFELEETRWGTIIGKFESVRFSLFVYQYPTLDAFHEYQQIQLAGLKDIAAMKLEAIGSRGIKRDFVDLYFICQHGISLPTLLELYEKKYGDCGSKKLHILKSLIYFAEAEESEMPKMPKPIDWKTIQKFFEKSVPSLVHNKPF